MGAQTRTSTHIRDGTCAHTHMHAMHANQPTTFGSPTMANRTFDALLIPSSLPSSAVSDTDSTISESDSDSELKSESDSELESELSAVSGWAVSVVGVGLVCECVVCVFVVWCVEVGKCGLSAAVMLSMCDCMAV